MKKLYSAALAAAFVCGVALGVWTHTAHDAQSDPEPGQASSSSIARSYLTVLLRDTSRVAPQLHKLTDGSEYFGAGDAGAASIREDSGAAFAFAVLAVEYAAAPEPDATTRRASLVPSLARLRSTPPLRHADGESVAALRTVDVRYALGLIQFLVRSHRMGSGAALDGGHWGASDNSPVDAANLGMATYLLRPYVAPQLWSRVSDVVHFEAQRFLLQSAGGGASNDSAAVTNAAASQILCVAGCLYASGPTASAYQRRSDNYLQSVLTLYSDVTGPGSPAPTLFPDLTLQWNGGFSPSAELQVLGSLSRCALCYSLTGRAPPAALRQRVQDVWQRVLLVLSLPDGCFLTGSGGVVYGGAAVSWLAAAFDDPAARTLDAFAAARLLASSDVEDAPSSTPLTQGRLSEVACQALVHEYFPRHSTSAEALDEESLNRSLTGVKWFRTAGLVVHRTDRMVMAFSWSTGTGQVWLIPSRQHVRWHLFSAREEPIPTSGVIRPPTISQESNSFAALGTVRLDSGVEVQAAVYSLPDGPIVFVVNEPPGQNVAALSFARDAATEEPDLFRDDEAGPPPADDPRWLNIDNELGLVFLDCKFQSLAPPGVSDGDNPRRSWPLATVESLGAGAMTVAIYPDQEWRATAAAAASSQSLDAAGPGWAGALLPTMQGSNLLVSHFSGEQTTVLGTTSNLGAPVPVEEASITGTVSTISLSNPAGSVRYEPISCWLNAGLIGSVQAQQGDSPGVVSVSNPSSTPLTVQARYISTGRACQVITEDGRTIVKLQPHEGMGEVRFYLAPGRSVTVKY